MLAATPRPVRRAPLNKQPGLLPIDLTPDNIAGGRLPLELYRQRAALLRADASLRERILRILAASHTDGADPDHVEQRIYRGFASSDDQQRLARFHLAPWEERPRLLRTIEDPRYRQLGMRAIATERPNLLSESERTRWHAWLRERWDASDVPWRGLEAARLEVEGLDPAFAAQHASAIAPYRAYLASFAEPR